MWRLQNDMTPVSRIVPKKEEESDQPSFTEITIDVRAGRSRRRLAEPAPLLSDARLRPRPRRCRATLDLAEQLIARRSVTPEDGGCQALLAARLEAIGFAAPRLPFGPTRRASATCGRSAAARAAGGKLLVFAGHTDVVPTGPLAAWPSDPFVPTRRDGTLYGRGAADMKSSIAAMVVAAEEFVAAHAGARRQHRAARSPATRKAPRVDGTARVCDWLAAQAMRLDYCVVGEPTSVRTARRHDQERAPRHALGQAARSRACRATSPIRSWRRTRSTSPRRCSPSWSASSGTDGNAHFPPTSWQMSNVHAGTGAGNVIPGELVDRLQLPLLHRVDAGVAARAARGDRRRHGVELRDRVDARRRAVPDAAPGR